MKVFFVAHVCFLRLTPMGTGDFLCGGFKFQIFFILTPDPWGDDPI